MHHYTSKFQPWCQNFDSTKLHPYDGRRPIWIQIYNMPMEYWAGNCLEKIGQTFGTLTSVDMDILEGDFRKYVRLQIVAVRKIPDSIILVVKGRKWVQKIEIEEDKFFCVRCKSRIIMREDV